MIQQRGGAVIAARKMSSAMSAAQAIANHMKHIWQGTAPGEYASMGVISEGSYDIPKDIMFSFPVEIKNREWTVVQVCGYFYFILFFCVGYFIYVSLRYRNMILLLEYQINGNH